MNKIAPTNKTAEPWESFVKYLAARTKVVACGGNTVGLQCYTLTTRVCRLLRKEEINR